MNVSGSKNTNTGSIIAVSFFIFALATFLPVESALCMDGGALKNIAFQDTGEGFKVEIRTNAPIGEYRPACLLSPSRMVIDLMGNWKNPGKNVYETGNGVLKKIVVGEHRDRLRVVMHLQGNVRLDPIISQSGNELVLEAPARLIEDLGGDEHLLEKSKLKSLVFESSPGVFRLALGTDEPVAEHRSFIVSDGLFPSLIIDVPGRWDYPGEPVMKVESDMVDVVRIGEHAEFIRIAIDLMITGPFSHETAEVPEGLDVSVRK